jgi:hypothetical protein
VRKFGRNYFRLAPGISDRFAARSARLVRGRMAAGRDGAEGESQVKDREQEGAREAAR